MNKEEQKNRFGYMGLRVAAIVLAVMVVVSYLPVGFAYAAGNKTTSKKTSKTKTTTVTEDPIREVHKVKVGSKRYCFFVTHNVVLTPKEVAEFGDNDEKLTEEVLKRAGLYMKEANCKDSSHKVIWPEDWEKNGGTLNLSKVEIYEEEEVEVEEKADDADDASKKDADDSGEKTDGDDSGESGDDSGSGDSGDGSEATDPSDSGEGSGEGDSGDTPSEDSDTPSEDASDEDSKKDEATPAAAAKVLTGEMVKVDATEALRKAAPTDGNPSRFYMDIVITDKNVKNASGEPKKYSTFKKSSPSSPKLIYVAVATEKDAKLGESICEENNGGSNKNKKGSNSVSVRDTSGDDEEDEDLPEYRTISMTDRSGGPLEPTLKDGDPVTLEWKEPGLQTDTNLKKGFFSHSWAIPAVVAAVLAIALGVILYLRSRDKEEEEEA